YPLVVSPHPVRRSAKLGTGAAGAAGASAAWATPPTASRPMTDRPLENLILNPPTWQKSDNSSGGMGRDFFWPIPHARRMTAKCNSARTRSPMQQACHARADIGREDFGRAHAQEATENTEVFDGAHRSLGASLGAWDSVWERVRTTKVRHSQPAALLWVSAP